MGGGNDGRRFSSRSALVRSLSKSKFGGTEERLAESLHAISLSQEGTAVDHGRLERPKESHRNVRGKLKVRIFDSQATRGGSNQETISRPSYNPLGLVSLPSASKIRFCLRA